MARSPKSLVPLSHHSLTTRRILVPTSANHARAEQHSRTDLSALPCHQPLQLASPHPPSNDHCPRSCGHVAALASVHLYCYEPLGEMVPVAVACWPAMLLFQLAPC